MRIIARRRVNLFTAWFTICLCLSASVGKWKSFSEPQPIITDQLHAFNEKRHLTEAEQTTRDSTPLLCLNFDQRKKNFCQRIIFIITLLCISIIIFGRVARVNRLLFVYWWSPWNRKRMKKLLELCVWHSCDTREHDAREPIWKLSAYLCGAHPFMAKD